VSRIALAAAVLAVLMAAPAAAYAPPQMRVRELDVSDRPVGPWLALDGARLHSANGVELGVVLEKSGEHVLVEVTSVPPGTAPADQFEVYDICLDQTGTPGEVVDLDQRIRYAGNGSYGVRMTVSDSSDASSACRTANPSSAEGTFSFDARTTVRRIGVSPIVLDATDQTPAFAGWAVDPPDLAHFPELRCALNAQVRPDSSLTGSVTKDLVASKDRRVRGQPYVADASELPRPGVWTCAGHQVFGGALVHPPWSAPTEPELVREVWYGLRDPVIRDGRPRHARITARAEPYYAGAKVSLRLRRSRCDHKLRTTTVAKSKISATGKLVFRFKLPSLRRFETGNIYATDTTISGSRLVVPRRVDEPTILVDRDGLHGVLGGCDRDGSV
jgi:hypothetical protein